MHVLAAAIGAAAAAVRWVCQKKKKKRDHNNKKRDLRNGEWLPGGHHFAAADGSMSFSSAQIMAATRNFSETRVIGFGSQGKVFRGVIVVDVDGSNSTEVAVKRATRSSPGQSACKLRRTEIEALCKLRHRHLVPLIGSCSCSKEGETILVYQYMPRGTLREHLRSSVVVMPWWRRLDACMGAARGLHSLHAGGVVHGAVKASNVLFDESWVAKLSDYGLSNGATMESDIHCFGVLLFEVLMERRGDVVGGLVDYALACHRNGTLQDAIDPEIKDQVAPGCLKKFAETAVDCLAGNGIERLTIGDVLWNLELAVQLQLLNSKRT